LFLFTALVYGYLLPIVAGKSFAAWIFLQGANTGSALWWIDAHNVAFNTFVSGLFPLFIGGFIAADSIGSEFESNTIVPLLSQPVRRSEVYVGKLLEKVLLLLVVSTVFTLLVVVGSEVSVGAQSHLEMIPVVVLAEFGAFLEYTALAFFIGSIVQSGTTTLGVMIAVFMLILGTVLVVSLQTGEQEYMFLLPTVNADFLLKAVFYSIFQPFGVMVLQGYALGGGYTTQAVASVISAVEYAVVGLLANLLAALAAGYYFFRRAEVKR
jgi:ABC-type transport system involved in multi-copper enzyme maturation permease subunit